LFSDWVGVGDVRVGISARLQSALGGLTLGKKEILRRFAPLDDGQVRLRGGLGG
jgi:hypothetical protein